MARTKLWKWIRKPRRILGMVQFQRRQMKKSPSQLTKLKVNYFVAPIGIDEEKPRFSWQMSDPRQGAKQEAYRLQVETAGKINWDSGWVESRKSAQVSYEGSPLRPLTPYLWRVKARDMNGQETAWSESSFETGFMFKKWKASWIQGTNPGITLQPATYFRNEFKIPAGIKIRRARLYATALGTYTASINGKPVSDAILAPGWTDFRARVQYQTYDIGKLLQAGDNAVGIVLGDGWYCGAISYWCTHSSKEKPHFGLPPAIRAELFIESEDGSSMVIASDPTWRCSQGGPIRSSDLYHGETYDANLEMQGWDHPGFNASGWNLTQFTSRTQEIVWTSAPPIKRFATVKAVSVSSPKEGVQIVDFGQNMAGRERFTVKAPAGTKIVIRHGEMLSSDGSLYTKNLGAAKATTTYISNGRKSTYSPSFTSYGFRYIEVIGWPGVIKAGDFVAEPISSDMERTGFFECSNALINRLYENVIWGQRSNYVDVPTDCPQRSERQGWTGDAQAFVNAGSYNFHAGGFFNKWLTDLESSRNAYGEYPVIAPSFERWSSGVSGWADAALICPWHMYLKYGDAALLERHYPAMRKWILFQRDNSNGLIRKSAEYADWLNMDAPTSEELISTAFFAYGTQLMARIASIIGKGKDAEEFKQLLGEIKEAYAARFISPKGQLLEKTQTAALLTLKFDLAPDEKSRKKIIEGLAEDIRKRKTHLSTGFLGTPYLAPLLVDCGKPELAFALLEQTSFPSWLYPVTQGATTIWERWNSWTHKDGFGPEGMNSFNHYAYGAVADFLYEYVGGIRPLEDGGSFSNFILSPVFGGALAHASIEYRSEYGAILSSWKKSGKNVTWEIAVPPNSTALLRMPAFVAEYKSEGLKTDQAELCVPAGKYNFKIKLK